MLHLSHRDPSSAANILADLVIPVRILELRRHDRDGSLGVVGQWRRHNMYAGVEGEHEPGVGLVENEVAARQEHFPRGGDGGGYHFEVCVGEIAICRL